ncbi:glycosyltransferase [Candidatus Venteria ishoeyi]|uniref:glycosyltransferase n=1 Tax=Candidatus Venteria ishoeyi TaxID=1899563 RepID=UPI0025A60C2B|nr:glycosyltransferase [Candidatus Venteria ishoeyi]MDM8545160.1 glycosyltransferase [Candidatus Venteria ishoeyi]
MPRILHIGKYYPPFAGGIENFMADLLPEQQAQGDEVYALVHDHRLPGWNPVLPLHQAADPDWLFRCPSYGRLLYAPVAPHFPLWFSRLLKRIQPDILHFHLPNTSAFWALLSPSARKIPWVLHWHSDVVSSDIHKQLALAYRLYQPFEQALLKRSAAIIATSPLYQQASPALAPWQPKTHTISLGMDLKKHQKMPTPQDQQWAEKSWGDSRLRILCIGRMTYYKGHEVLLQALEQLPDVHLILVGKGEMRETLQQHIQQAGLSKQVSLPGYLEDAQLQALFTTCDCFCLPSLERTEAFGVVLMEAMSYGKPCVASNIPGSGVGWVVQDGKNGLLVPVGDADALATALQQLTQQPALRQQLGENAAIDAQQRFAIQPVAEQIQALYRDVLG